MTTTQTTRNTGSIGPLVLLVLFVVAFIVTFLESSGSSTTLTGWHHSLDAGIAATFELADEQGSAVEQEA